MTKNELFTAVERLQRAIVVEADLATRIVEADAQRERLGRDHLVAKTEVGAAQDEVNRLLDREPATS